MKRILLILIISLSIVSCKQSNEDLIKKEFKTYVKENFNNPKDFKEIVSIELIDSNSTLKTYRGVKTMYDMSQDLKKEEIILQKTFKEAWSIEMMNDLGRIATSNQIQSYLKSLTISEIYSKSLNDEELLYGKSRIKIFLDNFKYTPPVYSYKVKYREYDNKQLKIKGIHCSFDSLSHKIVFSHTLNYSEEEKELLSNFEELANYVEMQIKNNQLKRDFINTAEKIHDMYYPKEIK